MTAQMKVSLQAFLAAPETKPYREYVRGEVEQKPMPDRFHARLQLLLGLLIHAFLKRTPLGEVGSEWRCVFGPPGEERAFVPDVVFATHAQIAVPGKNDRAFLWTAPDLAVEILSPDQPADEFADKLQFYLLHGVRLVWVVNPEARTIRVYQPGEDARILRAGDTLDGADVLPGLAVPVADIFAELGD